MYKNKNSFSSTSSNYSKNIKKENYENVYFNNCKNVLDTSNNIGVNKKVQFNNNIEMIYVESYKEHNKLLCFNEEDINNNVFLINKKQNYFENRRNIRKRNKNRNNYRKRNNSKIEMNKITNKKEEGKCCCIII